MSWFFCSSADSVISVGVPMPSFNDGAMPKSVFFISSRVLVRPDCAIPETRTAVVASVARFTSTVVRAMPLVVTDASTSVTAFNCATLLPWFTTPPVDPRPNSIDDGPISTSTASSAKVSR